MKAAVPKLSFSGFRMARYCFIIPISSMRLVFAKTVVSGVLIFLAIWFVVSLLFSWMRVRMAMSFSSSFRFICKNYRILL